MLPKHIDQMSDEELEQWIQQLIRDKAPESHFLDYKEKIKHSSRLEKVEIAKDISSFANTSGGTVIYGIPDEVQDDGTILPSSAFGIDPILNVEEIAENILTSSIVPLLPSLRIRKINLSEPKGKVMYMLWHPESWEAPHMIHAYGEKRYYKRGNFRAVPMEEEDVRRLYLKKQTSEKEYKEFINLKNFGTNAFAPDVPLIQFIIVPVFLFHRINFSTQEDKQWLKENVFLFGASGNDWRPFLHGVRTIARSTENVKDEKGDVKKTKENVHDIVSLFNNAAVSFCGRAIFWRQEKQDILARTLIKEVEDILSFASKFYNKINFLGPVRIYFGLKNVKDFSINLQVDKFLIGDLDDLYWSQYERIWHESNLEFTEMSSGANIIRDLKMVTEKISNRLVQAFGVWKLPDSKRR